MIKICKGNVRVLMCLKKLMYAQTRKLASYYIKTDMNFLCFTNKWIVITQIWVKIITQFYENLFS